MFKEEIMDKYFCNKHTQRIPILYLSECLMAFAEVISKIREENPDAKLSELLDE